MKRQNYATKFAYLLQAGLVKFSLNVGQLVSIMVRSIHQMCFSKFLLTCNFYSYTQKQFLFVFSFSSILCKFYPPLVFFTALPPFAIGIFDKVYSAETLYRNPRLYENFQSAKMFNVRVFWIWIGNAMVHSIILFWMPKYAFEGDIIWSNGRDGGYLVLGNMVYTVNIDINVE
jgi:phospholipid-transporting ATPase